MSKGKTDIGELIAYTKKVQNGEEKTPDTLDNIPLNLLNKLTINTLYPEDRSDVEREKSQVRLKFLDKTPSLKESMTPEQKENVQQYINDKHPSLRALLTTSPQEIADADSRWIRQKGSAFAARNLQFFDKWEEGLGLITSAQDAISTALKDAGGELTLEVRGTLAEYEVKALAYMENQLTMTPATMKVPQTIQKQTTFSERPWTFGANEKKYTKAEALAVVGEKIKKANAPCL